MKKKAKQNISRKDFIDLKQEVKKLDKKVDGLDKKVDGLDKKVDGLDKKVDGLDKSILSYKGEIDFKVDDYFQKTEEREKKYHSQIMDILDEVMGEIKLNREERIVMAHQVQDHEGRISVLEQKLPAFN